MEKLFSTSLRNCKRLNERVVRERERERERNLRRRRQIIPTSKTTATNPIRSYDFVQTY